MKKLASIMGIVIGLLLTGILLPISLANMVNITAYGTANATVILICCTVLPMLGALGIALKFLDISL